MRARAGGELVAGDGDDGLYGDDCGGGAGERWGPQIGEILGVVCPMTAGARDVGAERTEPRIRVRVIQH